MTWLSAREASSIPARPRPHGSSITLEIRFYYLPGTPLCPDEIATALVTSPSRGRRPAERIKVPVLREKVERDGKAAVTDTQLERGRRSHKATFWSGISRGCSTVRLHAKVTESSRPSKEVSWPSVTAALPRNTGTSTTTLASRELTGSARNGR